MLLPFVGFPGVPDTTVMEIFLVRHAAVDMPTPVLCTASMATDLLEDYNHFPIAGFDPLPVRRLLGTEELTIYTSEMSRAVQTAQKLFPDDTLRTFPIFNEYELSMISVPVLPLPYKAWTTLSRFFWFMHLNNKGESRTEASQRRKKATALLIGLAQQNKRIVLVAHGFLISEMRRELKKHGWQIMLNQGNKNLTVTKLVRRDE